MHLTKSSVFVGATIVGVLSVAIPAPERRSTAHNATAKRANPTISNSDIMKRANPTIGDGINVNDPQRGGKLVPRSNLPTSGAFSNALELMNYATTTIDDAVFGKYFNPDDKHIVIDVFNRLVGDDSSGAADLANIKVIAGDDDPNDPAPAALEGFDDQDPSLVLSEDAWSVSLRSDIVLEMISG